MRHFKSFLPPFGFLSDENLPVSLHASSARWPGVGKGSDLPDWKEIKTNCFSSDLLEESLSQFKWIVSQFCENFLSCRESNKSPKDA